MTRPEIIQAILDLFDRPDYLEIGVDNGLTFNKLTAAHKRAVDPAFKFQTQDQHSATSSITHYPMTSDAYFAGPGALWMPDVAFIDGLHTFEQTLRDLLNVQTVLKRPGAIVIDDINPTSYHASLPDEAEAFRVRDHQTKIYPQLGSDWSWMGDVYKLVFFIRSFMQGWDYAVVLESRMQLVLWRSARPQGSVGGRSFRAVEETEFRDVVALQDEYQFQPMEVILARIRESFHAA